ncbi:MAG: DNA recombination protein RmuC [bacterium]
MAIINLPAVLSIVLFAALAAVAVSFIRYAGRQKKLTSEIIDKSLLEKDGLTKKIIVLEEDVKNLNGRLEEANGALNGANVLAEKLREDDKSLFAKVSELTADNKNLRETLESRKADYEAASIRQKQEFSDLESRFKEAFENLSSKMLEDKSKKFLEINKDSISGILNPLSEKILEFQKKVEETYDKESKDRFSLKNEIDKLVATEKTMEQTTNNLTAALKGTGKVQGDWGEMILESILENSGLREGIDYEIQKNVKTTDEMDEKINLRPDVTIHLPKSRDLIVDSKVSLTDYERYISLAGVETKGESDSGGNNIDKGLNVNADNSEGKDKDKFLKLHVNSIKRHINEMEKYHNLPGSKSLDAVIMFIPVEFAYTVAVNYDRDLLVYAYGRNVIIATPSIIMLILKIVSNLWVQEKSQEKAVEVMMLAGQLYDKFCSFSKSMEDIGSSIDKTAAAYDNARKLLVSGKGNLMSRAERIKQLGAKTAKSLDRGKFEHEEYTGLEYEEPLKGNENGGHEVAPEQ